MKTGLLIIKDFRANWMYQLWGLAILFFASVVFTYIVLKENGRADPELVIYFIVVLLSSSAVSLLFMIIDELYQTDELFISLPVKRNQIVIAKYTSSIVQIILALSVHFLGVQIVSYFFGELNNSELKIIYNPIVWLSIFIILLLFKSYAYPLYFKFGLTKGVGIHCVIQFLILVIFIISCQIHNPSYFIQRAWQWILNQNVYLILMSIIGSFLLLLYGSLTLSKKLYRNKEL
ncbi:ABC-2 transporter permease [uncultured Winogradskyella sp.]|uniref:ABC-2 transporter permease n=1 Tax=uncultured Winogradskyella sp. TaxID=395353 RepID=UPI0030D88337|tara:strand:+ start:13755 stop:14453 length:699 start_codon:yes stop_codon:yes gene_type:complete